MTIAKNTPWRLGIDNRIADSIGLTVADCRYASQQGEAIVEAVNSYADHEREVAELKGLLREVRELAVTACLRKPIPQNWREVVGRAERQIDETVV